MKVKLSLNNKFDGFSSNMRASGSGTQCRNNELAHYKKSVHLINEDRNKVSITRPAESVSFSGSAVSDESKENKESKFNKSFLIGGTAITALAAGALYLAHGAKKNNSSLAEKLAKSKTFHKITRKSDENEATIKALIALGLAGVLKPICVLAMPGAEKEDKQFTATKNCLSAFIGYLLSCAIFNPISRGVNEFLKNPGEYIKDENNWLLKQFSQEAKEAAKDTDFKKLILTPELIKAGKQKAAKEGMPYYYTDMKTGMKTVYKNTPGLIVAPLKAALTIALMPFILKFVFGDSKGKKKAEEQEQKPVPMEIINNSTLTAVGINSGNMDKVFNNFAKGGFKQ